MTEQDIVERLTVAQKQCILRLPKARYLCNARTTRSLFQKGLTTDERIDGAMAVCIILTPLGLSIRKLLEKQNG